ncbi:MAG: nuclear transport factor 2 family protein, partial [Pseudomonadales bacterium]
MRERPSVSWETYKALADSPQVWTRWMLEQTLELLRWDDAAGSAVAVAIASVLAESALAKPADHRGAPSTDLFKLDLSTAETGQLLGLVRRAEREGVRTSGTMQRGLGGFRAAWNEYDEFLRRLQEKHNMTTASDRVLAMISGWNERDLEAIVDCFADDAVYHNIPMEPVQGKQGIRE